MLKCSNRQRGIALAEMLAVAAFCAGCGSVDEPPRVAMHGKVSLNGVPVQSGSISLLPETGNEAPSANALIQQGDYRFNKENGPLAGAYRVLVMGAAGGNAAPIEATDAKAVGKIPGPKSAPPPPRTKREWNLKVEVPDVSDFEHNIELQ